MVSIIIDLITKHMENLNNFIEKDYKELIQYLCCIGHSSTTNYKPNNVYIQIRNKEGEVFLEFRLEYYRDSSWTLDYNYIQVAWRLTGYSSFSHPHKFHKDMDQKVMFDIMLFEINNWKLSHIDELITKTISKTLDSGVITNWLKTKEEQIRIEERVKIETHLSMDEFRKVIKEELCKIKINFKIGD